MHEPEPEGAIRIVVVDDREAMRESLRVAFSDESDIAVVAEASDLATLTRDVEALRAHVLLLDVGMPGEESVELVRRLHRRVPQAEVVVLTSNDDPVFARRILDAGVMGFVVRAEADIELPIAVRSVARGERYISPGVGRSLASLYAVAPTARLTPRELEVLQLIAHGFTSTEAAGKLTLSPRTIETHRARIQLKLKLESRAELVTYALLHGLIGTRPPGPA